MSLVPDYDSSSGGSDAESTEEDENIAEFPINKDNIVATSTTDQSSDKISRDNEKRNNVNSLQQSISLPSASELLSGSGRNTTGIVFNNPYKDAENAKIASLEKHVKMVATEEHTQIKNGKKICWNFRKGRCRFGSNCTFAHDSDLHRNDEDQLTEPAVVDSGLNKLSMISATLSSNPTKRPQSQTKPSTMFSGSGGGQARNNDNYLKCNDSKGVGNNLQRKKRPGLGNSIVPSKKVMKHYNKTSK